MEKNNVLFGNDAIGRHAPAARRKVSRNITRRIGNKFVFKSRFRRADTSGQVCVEPRTSALGMTLPSAAARAPVAVNRYLLPAPRQRQAPDIERRDRQAGGRTDAELSMV